MSAAAGDPVVSVIVPTYGRPDSLARAVESVADQTYGAVELVVVDDHSPSPVRPVLEQARLSGVHWQCHRHDENRGASAARQTGIDESAGEVVAFLDDDDYWGPELVERVVERFETGGRGVGVVTVGARVVDSDGRQIGRARPEFSGKVTREILTGAIEPGTYSRIAVRRRLVEAAGGPDSRFPSWQDKEWHVRLSQHCSYASVPDPLVVRRYLDQDQITDDFEAKRDVSYPLLVEKYGDLAVAYGPECHRQFLGHLTESLGFSALRNGHYCEAVRYLVRAIRHDPGSRSSYVFLLAALGGPLTYWPASRLRRWLAG